MELKNISVNGTKGKGKGSWTSAQTSVIAKNGGEITTDNFKDIGAIVGSENEKEKLKISAKTIEVKDLEDSNKYENVGGGISLGFEENKPQVPNISVVHDKIDKKQITRATALNTEIKVNNEIVKAEDLGFNTDISNSQETTKDKEKHLNAELHTDLIGEDKRNEIKYAFKKLGSLHEILDQKKFKESMEGVLLDKFKDEHQKEFNLIKEESLSLEDKQKLAQNLIERYLRENGYEGEIPEVLLTDEAHSFSVDSKDKETGAKRREKIYFSINDIADPNLAFSKLFGHEKAHMNTYDEGKDGEETAIHTRGKIGSENKNKVFTEEEKADYLNSLRNKYKDQKSIEEQFAEAKLVPEKDKEHWAVGISGNISLAFIGRVNFGVTDFYVYNENNGDKYYAESKDIGIGLGIPGAGISGSVVFLKNVNTSQEIDGYSFVSGASVTVLNGELIYDNKTKELAGIRIGISASVGVIPGFDLYGSVDSSILTKSKKLSDSQTVDQANLERNVNKLMKLANNKNEAQKNISEINNTILKIKNILERNKKRWK